MNKMKNVYFMYAIIFLQGFVFYGPVATLFRQARGLSMSEIFIIESISWVVIIILEVPWGWISDRFGYKRTLIVVNTLFFLSKIVFYLAHSFESFLLERLILSVVLSGLSGCDTAIIYDSIDPSQAQKVFGRYSAFGTLGFMLASILSAFIIPISLDYTALFTIVPYGVSVVVTFYLREVKTDVSEKTNIIQHFKSTLKDRSIWIFVFAIVLVVEVAQAVTVFLNQAQYIKSGIDPKYFGLIIALIQGVRLMSVKASGASRKLGDLRAIGLFIVLIIGGCLVLAYTNGPILSVLGVLIIALSISMIGPIEVDIKNKSILGKDRATILSIYSMVGGLLASAGNIIIGRVAEYSLRAGFLTCVGMSLVSLILLLVYSRYQKALKKSVKVLKNERLSA